MMRKINNRKVNERDIERVKLILGDMELSFHISEIGHFQMNCSKSHIVKKGDVCYEEVAEILEIEIEAGCLGEIEQLLNHIYTIGLKYVILVRSDDHTRNYVYSVAEAAQKKTTFRVTSRGDFRIVIGEEYYDCEHFAKYESSARSLFFGGDPRDSKGAVAINKYTSAKLKSNHFELITDRQFILKNALAEILDICGLHYKADRERIILIASIADRYLLREKGYSLGIDSYTVGDYNSIKSMAQYENFRLENLLKKGIEKQSLMWNENSDVVRKVACRLRGMDLTDLRIVYASTECVTVRDSVDLLFPDDKTVKYSAESILDDIENMDFSNI